MTSPMHGPMTSPDGTHGTMGRLVHSRLVPRRERQRAKAHGPPSAKHNIMRGPDDCNRNVRRI